MRIGIFGGTFNPVHNGHIAIINYYLKNLSLDKIIVIPTNIPPHKSNKNVASFSDRINMLNVAFSSSKDIEISDIELKLGGKSYTINTLKKLKELYPTDDLFLLVGGDMFLCFDKWKDYKKILSLCTVCAAPRENDEYLNLIRYQKKLDPQFNSTIVLDAPVIELSSSEIRDGLLNNDNLESLVPKEVYNYIKQKGLYAND